MPNNYFVTGSPKSGKTTLLHRVVERLKKKKLNVVGIISPEQKSHGTRTGFYVMDVKTRAVGRLAAPGITGPKVSKYGVDIRSFENIALNALKDAEKADIVVIDEIGPMEMKSMKFADRLEELLDHHVHLIATLHNAYANQFAIYGRILWLDETNRESITVRLLRKLDEEEAEEKKKPGRRDTQIRIVKRIVKPEKKKAAPAKKKPVAKIVKKKAKPKKAKKRAVKKAGRKKKPAQRKGIFNHLKRVIGI
jgi:nucleoside-triphosphatase